MKAEEINEAKRIIYDMMNHPGSKFIKGNKGGGFNSEIYNNDGSESLEDIIDKLNRRAYYNSEEWINDVRNLYRKITTIYGDSMYSRVLSNHLIDTFNKATKYSVFRNSNEWSQVYLSIETKVGRLVGQSPISLERTKTNINIGQKINAQLIGEKELIIFTKGIQMIKDVEEQESLLDIIRKQQPELNIERSGITHVNVMKLKQTTIRELNKKVKELLKLHGLTNPGAS